MDNDFRLDRSCFQGMTIAEADRAMTDYKNVSPKERLAIANYLNSGAFDFLLHSPPAMDKTICTPRNLLHG